MDKNGNVYISFNHKDSSVSYFISHLSDAFSRQGIFAFFDDGNNHVKPTEEKEEEGFSTSKVFVVVFSQNFVSHLPCLEKQIYSCRKNDDFVVVPVFYRVSISSVKKHMENSGDEFEAVKRSMHKLRRCHEYDGERSEREFLEEIVSDVFEKLYPTEEIGIQSSLQTIKNLLCKQPWGVRTIGIFGDPGIGKTSLARSVFRQMSGGYDDSCFIDNFQIEYNEKRLAYLPTEYLSRTPIEKFDRNNSDSEPRYRKKRVLVALDDVGKAQDAKSFLGGFDKFGPGSLIIITSRYKKVLRECSMNEIYKLKGLNYEDSMKLFRRCAFGKDVIEENLVDPSSVKAIECCYGNPSALRSYAKEFKSKTTKYMESALPDDCEVFITGNPVKNTYIRTAPYGEDDELETNKEFSSDQNAVLAGNFSPSVGSCVWVEDRDEAWIDGEVVEVNGEDIKVLSTSGKHVVTKASAVYPKDTEAPASGVDDMTRLAYLHEPGVLQNLHSRYDINEIYTYTGSILIAVNPFRRLPHLYSSHMMAQYKGAALGELSPHPFAVADAAYRQMINDGVSQSILVSGESGAGKTESTKLLMRYLAYMGGRAASEGRSVEQKVLESNPVLEAFGNAKTVRNNNSSRFGKFVEIQFDGKGRISGAAIRTYLLERSRVCQVSDPERNYHCFYMLCAAPKEDVERYKLGEPKTYHYLNQSKCLEVDSINDAEEYHATRRAMDVVGISTEEQDAIFSVVAAILHLGNVEFAKGAEIDSSVPKDEKSLFHLKTAAGLLSCDEKALEDSLCKRIMVTRDETITKTLDPEAATLSRDALAKVMYSRLFDWLVDKINSSIGQDPHSKYLIGVLDIYGFESFKTNSFEQFCINLTNEKLQQHFNQHVFKMEQEEYKEEINWSYIEFVDNQDILDLIEKKPGGIIALLDEACMFPRSTHETFAQKLYQTFKNHKRFTKPKLARSDFTICHYAGDVTYQTELFLDKNKDYVIAEHQALLNSSSCSFVASLFPPMSDDSNKSKFSSIGTRFKQQLVSLLEILNTTEPHYIRCIKPNNLLKPGIFENENILQQLRCGGVMEAIRISCAGYPTRKHFDEFLNRFGILAPEVLVKNSDDPAACKNLLEKVGLEGYQIGKTKVFLRAGQMADLDTRRTEVLGRSASIIQRKVRSYLAKKSFILLRNSAKQIQSVCRGYLARNVYEGMRREAAALKIQRDLRMFLARKDYTELCSASVSVQAGMRGMVARNELCFRRQTKAAKIIQTWCRGYLARLHYRKLKKAAITTQCAWRSKIARGELRKLKMAARETGALQEAKNKLEKQVEELTWRLQLEKRIRTDLEEAKKQESAKAQSSMEELELRCKETEALLIKEREAAKKVAEIAPIIKEVPVVDQELVEKITNENEKLKGMVSSLEMKIDETEKKLQETTKISEDRLKQALDAESKLVKLKTAMRRLEEKIFDMEAEKNIMRQHQQTISSTPVRTTLGQPPTAPFKNLENGNQINLESEFNEAEFTTPVAGNAEKSAAERQIMDADALIDCVKDNIGFSNGKPVAAFTIYKCLLHWKCFESEKTNVFDRLIQMIGSAIENEDDNSHLAYWLTSTSALLFLLQKSLKTGGSGATQSKKPPTATSLFGRMAMSFRSSPASGNLAAAAEAAANAVIRPVEAKYPALLFKQQLAAYVEKMFGMVRDNLKKELSTLLSLCIQAPRTSKGGMLRSGRSFGKDSPATHWQSIIDGLNSLLITLKENHVPLVLIQKIYSQTFSFINVQLFNSLLLRKECCTFSNGEFVKAGLAELELWCCQAKEYAGPSWEELKQIRQAVGFLVIHQKYRISYDDIAHDLCPGLSVQQLYRICTLYWDDSYNTRSVSQEVISSMRALMTEESNDADSDSFLLDDDSSIPFSIDDISSSMQEKDFVGIKPAEELLENPAFVFLH